MKRPCLFPSLTIVMTLALAAGCSGPDDAATGSAVPVEGSAGSATSAEKVLPKIPILPGYKYYVGGPVMDKDRYGRFRLTRFEGEVEQPPSRGMVFGAKRDGDKMEYKVWANGVLVGVHRGTFKDDIFWQEYAEGYRQGKLVAREHQVNDDEALKSRVTVEDIDPENGEVIRTTEKLLPYKTPHLPDEDDDEDEAPAAEAPAAGEKAAE